MKIGLYADFIFWFSELWVLGIDCKLYLMYSRLMDFQGRQILCIVVYL